MQIRIWTLLPLLATLALPACAIDSVVLINGAKIDGEIIADEPGKEFMFYTTQLLGIRRQDIKSISRDAKSHAAIDALKKDAKSNDADAQFKIYSTAKAAGFAATAQEALNATLAADPKHAGALAAKNGSVATVSVPGPGGKQVPIAVKSDPKTVWYLKLQHLCRSLAGDIPQLPDAPKADLAGQIPGGVIPPDHLEAVKALLGQSSNDPPIPPEEALEELKKNRYQVGETIAACLDFRVTADPKVRAGALKAVQKLKLKNQKISAYTSVMAVEDPDSYLREKVAEHLLDNGDPAAVNHIITHLVNCYATDGRVLHDPRRIKALDVLNKQKEKKLIYEALLYHVSQQLDMARLEKTQAFTGNGVIGTGTGGAQPIGVGNGKRDDTDIRNVSSTKGAEQALAALKDLSEQDYGTDWQRWRTWIAKQK